MAYTTIDKPTDYFNTKLYTGNSSTQSITGVGFQPDFVWIKDRIGATSVYSHHLFDVIRGATKYLLSNASDAEATDANTLTSFDSDGFSLGSDASTNASGDDVVAWNWKAGGSASSNTDGSITSSVSANTTAGFSIVSWTGTGSNATVGHGLGAVPQVFIIKKRSGTDEWPVYHHSLTNAEQVSLFLDLNSAVSGTSALRYNNTAPTSSVFSLGTSPLYNGSSATFIAYCFAEKKGFSKFGSYIGNGNAEGTFIYTGFKPAMVIYKNSSSVYDWIIEDNKRSTFNLTDDILYPNTSDDEDTGSGVDFLSNGVKLRSTANKTNKSGDTYIFMAFAESPFVNSNGVPTNGK